MCHVISSDFILHVFYKETTLFYLKCTLSDCVFSMCIQFYNKQSMDCTCYLWLSLNFVLHVLTTSG